MAPTAASFKKATKQDHPLTAVVLLDGFDQRFAPILSTHKCLGLYPICNVPLINYTMSWLMRTEVKNVMILVTGLNAKYADSVARDWKSVFDDFSIVVCDGATSIGDCLREVHNRELITNDFLLVTNPSSVTSSTLSTQIAEFRKRRHENADNVMTLLYSPCENREKSVIGIGSTSNKLVLYPPANAPTQLKVEKANFCEGVAISRDTCFTGIALCSRLIVTQFSDNFDFSNLDDVIREILSKDDILGLNIHVDVLGSHEAAFSAYDYDSLLHLNALLLDRWFYPLTPEKVDVSKFISVLSRNVYVETESATSKMNRISLNPSSVNVALGTNPSIHESVQMVSTSVGNNAIIGSQSKLKSCIVGDNCKIGQNCVIEFAFIGNNVVIPDGTKFTSGEIIIGNDVVIPSGFEYSSQTAVSSHDINSDEYDKIVSRKSDKLHIWNMRSGFNFWRRIKTKNGSVAGSDTGEDSDEDSEEEDDEFDGIVDNAKQFYDEVLESMKGILALENQQMSNLILEINSSKLACNVTMDDVAKHVFAAFLELPGNENFLSMRELIVRWNPLFKNYYKSSTTRPVEVNLKRKCQIHLLLAIEEKFDKDPEIFGRFVANLVHYLYNDVDVLEEEAILEWARSISEESSLKQRMQPIVDWLMEEDDEDEDEEEEEEEE